MPSAQGAEPHRRYYTRNRGEWDWRVDLRIKSFAALLASPEPAGAKLRITMSWLLTRLTGRFWLWTRVAMVEGADFVEHDTEFRKWGVVWFRSRERMHLLPGGRQLRIEGQQFIWPRMNKSEPFGPFDGEVRESSTEAAYNFEVLGAPCRFESRLDGHEGVMHFDGEWLRGSFELTAPCIERLAQRRAMERDGESRPPARPNLSPEPSRGR
jgi:hypothetical protein